MATFTIELGRLLGTGFDVELDNPEVYEIFDELYRPVLAKYIIDHFEFREIGQETPELFKRFLHRKLREIMPLYNEMYRSTLIEFNPLYSQDSESTATTEVSREGQSTDTSKADTDNINSGRTLVSSTPQTQMLNVEDYASGLTDSTSDGTTVSTAEANTVSQDESVTTYSYKVAGYSGQNPSEAIMRFRQSLINVNVMVLNELEVLFMGLWGTGGV